MADGFTRSRDHVASLERGLNVLEILAEHPHGITLSEMAVHSGSTRAAARRFLLTLQTLGYVRSEGRRFSVSAKIVSLSNKIERHNPIRQAAEPAMREISAALGESCSAAILDEHDIVYVARVAGRRIMTVGLDIGSRLPAYCTSMGRVLLAGLPEEALAEYFETAQLKKLTVHTITDPFLLKEKIRKVRANGYSVTSEELELGLRSIAVPLKNSDGAVLAALNVSTVPDRFSIREMVGTILPVLQRAATEVEARHI